MFFANCQRNLDKEKISEFLFSGNGDPFQSQEGAPAVFVQVFEQRLNNVSMEWEWDLKGFVLYSGSYLDVSPKKKVTIQIKEGKHYKYYPLDGLYEEK